MALQDEQKENLKQEEGLIGKVENSTDDAVAFTEDRTVSVETESSEETESPLGSESPEETESPKETESPEETESSVKSESPAEATESEMVIAPSKSEENETTKKIREIQEKKQEKAREKAEKQGKSNSAIIVAVAVVLILFVLSLFFAVFPRKTKLDLDKYITVSFEGYDAYGKANIKFDEDAYLKDYKKKIKLKKKGNFLQDSFKKNYGAAELLYDFYIQGNWKIEGPSEDGKLKNGDKVKITCTANKEELEENFKIKFSSKGKEFTVDKLKEVKHFDAFKDLEVEYIGVSPNGEIAVTPKGEMDGSNGYYFEFDPDTGLKNGDKIKVTVEPKDPSLLIQQFGMAPKETEKEITVEGLAAYVEKSSDIPESLMEEVKKITTDKAKTLVSGKQDEVKLVATDFLGYYFLRAKSDNSLYHNILYPVYKLTLEITLPEYNYTAQHSYYFTLSFSDFMDEGKGKVTVDLKATNTPYSFANIDTGVPVAFGTKQYNFVGFKDLAALKKECVDKYLDKYTMENTVKDTVSESSENGVDTQAESAADTTAEAENTETASESTASNS